MNAAPTLTVLLLCWNHSDFLERCIRSLAAQTSRDFTVLFLDNASVDGSAELAARLLADSGLPHHIVVNSEPAGISANSNRLAAEAETPLLSFLSADDWYAPRYVEAMLEAADRQPEAGLFYSGGWVFHEAEGRLLPVETQTHRSGDLFLPLLLEQNPMFFVGTCCRREAFEAVGGLDPALLIEDLDFFVRLARRYPFQRVDEPLVYYRRSAGAVSSDISWMIAGWEQFYAKHRGIEGVDMDRWLARMHRAYAAVAIDRGDLATGRHLLGRALRRRPLEPSAWRTLLYLLRSSIKRRFRR